MSTYTIEAGIPIPEPKKGKGGAPRGPRKLWTATLDQLAPGESILTTEHKDTRAAEQFRLHRPERVFAIRKIPGQGWRVWRVS